MAVKIVAVEIIPPATTVRGAVTAKVTARDITWNDIKTDFTAWNAAYAAFLNWTAINVYKG